MTRLGKWLVMLNLALSLFMATIALAVYSSAVDYSDKKVGGTEGKLVALKQQRDEIEKHLYKVEESWRVVRSSLLLSEEDRLKQRSEYARLLNEAYDSKGSILTVGYDQKNNPTMVAGLEAPGVPLRSLSVYQSELKDSRQQNDGLRKKLEGELSRAVAQTNELVGTPDGKVKGLRRELVEERDKYLGLVSEVGITDGLRINALVESMLVNKRLDAVNESVEHLQQYLKKKHGLDAALR